MSRKVTAYACDFKCGHSPFMRVKSAASHEENCIRNPAARCCPTCKHNKYEPHDVTDHMTGSFGGYYCEKDLLERHEKMRRRCEAWEAAT